MYQKVYDTRMLHQENSEKNCNFNVEICSGPDSFKPFNACLPQDNVIYRLEFGGKLMLQ